jgi:hypothetical protein
MADAEPEPTDQAADPPTDPPATDDGQATAPDIDALTARLRAVQARLADHAAAERPGLTRADAQTGDRWEAGQVWAHLAEFPGYWVGQVRAILAARDAGEPEPIPFGRTSVDPGRLAAIETRRREAPVDLLLDVEAGIASASTLAGSMSPEDWGTCGMHPVLGALTVATVVERFLIAHVEEHAAQLDELVPG